MAWFQLILGAVGVMAAGISCFFIATGREKPSPMNVAFLYGLIAISMALISIKAAIELRKSHVERQLTTLTHPTTKGER